MDGREASSTGVKRWRRVAHIDDLPPEGDGITLELDVGNYALFRFRSGVRTLDDACPHEGASLGMGVVIEGEVTCPWHSWHFRLEDGQNTDGLACEVVLHPTKIAPDGGVEVLLPESASTDSAE